MNSILPLCGADADVYAGVSIDAARRQLARKFRQRDLDAPELDARIIVGHVLRLDHTALAAHSDRVLTPEEAAGIVGLSARRLRSQPVARLLAPEASLGLPV